MLNADEQVEQIRIDRFDLISAEIAEDIVDAIQLAGNVLAVLPVGRPEALPGVECVETERAASKLNGGAGHRDRGHYELSRGDRANAEEPPPR